jgi:hypothetical protein
MNALKFEMADEEDAQYKEWLQKVSIKEGARIFPLLTYRGVDVYILDETSLMHTKTLKSIDGCVSTAKCKLKGYDRVVFESGANTGTALTEYGRKAGLETFLFIPEVNISLLNSKIFGYEKSHLISVRDSMLVKKAARAFAELNGLRHIPEIEWRYEAAMFRGLFILEQMMRGKKFDWLTQAISSAFGPIGIYRILSSFAEEIGNVPRFLGIQQEANCPMYKAWKLNRTRLQVNEMGVHDQLLALVMYDDTPHTYGTYNDLENILVTTSGDLTTIGQREFDDLLYAGFLDKSILKLLKENGVEITVVENTVLEKTGLMALAGTFKEIRSGKIEQGSTVLCCLTSGISEADGLARAEYTVLNLDTLPVLPK